MLTRHGTHARQGGGERPKPHSRRPLGCSHGLTAPRVLLIAPRPLGHLMLTVKESAR